MQRWFKDEAEKISLLESQLEEFEEFKNQLDFTLGDGRTTAIPKKLERRDSNVYDFAAH